MMAVSAGLLDTLTESLSSASTSLQDSAATKPPQAGVSLLDTKNELLLAYLQNLVFLIVFKLRQLNASKDSGSELPTAEHITKKLIELRIYLEKGVRPLEAKLKYQLDKLLAAAHEADALKAAQLKPQVKQHNENAEDVDVSDGDSGTLQDTGPAPISELSYRPNPSAFVRPAERSRYTSRKDANGVYKPPRITPTALPTTDRAAQRAQRPRKSATVDDFIREEMTDAPIAEPSIGTGSGLRGKAREKEEERRAYEEQKLVRLPGEKKRRRTEGGAEDLDIGFRGLADVDFGNVKGRGKKRKSEGGGGGERIGERWEKRVKKGVGRKRR